MRTWNHRLVRAWIVLIRSRVFGMDGSFKITPHAIIFLQFCSTLDYSAQLILFFFLYILSRQTVCLSFIAHKFSEKNNGIANMEMAKNRLQNDFFCCENAAGTLSIVMDIQCSEMFSLFSIWFVSNIGSLPCHATPCNPIHTFPTAIYHWATTIATMNAIKEENRKKEQRLHQQQYAWKTTRKRDKKICRRRRHILSQYLYTQAYILRVV